MDHVIQIKNKYLLNLNILFDKLNDIEDKYS
jgi:hypothetical protein